MSEKIEIVRKKSNFSKYILFSERDCLIKTFVVSALVLAFRINFDLMLDEMTLTATYH